MKQILIPVCIAIAAVLLLFCFGTGEQNTEPSDMNISNKAPSEKAVVKAQEMTPTPTPTTTVAPTVVPVVVTATPTAEPTKEIPHDEEATEEEHTELAEEEPQTEIEDADYEEPTEQADEPSASDEGDWEDNSEPVGNVEDNDGAIGEYLGTWTISFYCDCEICTGSWSGSPTASGVYPTAWHTAACGSLPFGTVVYVDGLGTFVVEDRGVYGDWLDIYLDDHDLCNEYGLQYRDVYIVG